jgi:hypothetical protein
MTAFNLFDSPWGETPIERYWRNLEARGWQPGALLPDQPRTPRENHENRRGIRKVPAALKQAASELGKRGGAARMALTTPEERREAGRRAAAARWNKP